MKIYIQKEKILYLFSLANILFLLSFFFGVAGEQTNTTGLIICYFEALVIVFGSAIIYLQFKIWFKRYI